MRTRAPLRLLAILLATVTTLAGLELGTAGADTGHPVAPRGIWLSADEIRSLPTSGPAWNAVKAAADGPPGVAMIADQDSDHDLHTMAAALVYARTGDVAYRAKAASGVLGAIGTETGGRTLALGRNLVGYVVAADLIDLAGFDAAGERAFRNWLDAVRRVELDGKTLISTHEIRPNNWGTHAGAARVAAAAYLGDAADLERAARVFRGWLGDRSAYAGFKYGDLTWQCDPNRPVGINPAGCTIQGHDVDGVLPDDQRRAGSFTWPPPQENYVWGGLQGAVVQAELLRRQGLDAWQWQGQALHRAVRWLHDVSGYPATGDDTWQPWLVNFAYGSSFPTTAVKLGKNMGFTDWTHARTLDSETTTTTTTSTTSTTSTTVATISTSDTSSTTTAEDPQAATASSVAVRSASSAGAVDARSISVATPPGSAVGDVLVATIDVRGKPSVRPPAGWTLLRADLTGRYLWKGTFVHVVTGVEPATHTWSFHKAMNAVTAVIASVAGVDPSAPVDAVTGAPGDGSAALTAPSAMATVSGAGLLALYGVANDVTIAAPAGMTTVAGHVVEDAVDLTSGVTFAVQAAAGATGDKTATASREATSVGHLVVLRPAE